MRIFPALRRLVTTVALGVLLAPSTGAVAFNEPPDFSNTSPGATYDLTVGTYTFLGSVTSGETDPDYFRVAVPAGMRITQVRKSVFAGGIAASVSFHGETITGAGAANFDGAGAAPYPLPAGAYTAAVLGGSSESFGWRIDIEVIPAADYIISTTGGAIVVTEHSRNGDTLEISEPSAGSIQFAAAGRTFSVNGGPPIAGHSGELSLAGFTSLSVDVAAGDDTINIRGFPGSLLPDFTIIGGPGDDVVNFSGDLTLAADRDLNVDAQTTPESDRVDRIVVAAGVKVLVTGDARIGLRCLQTVRLAAGASLEGRFLTIEANQQTATTPGNFVGVELQGGAALRAGFTVSISGRGGDDLGGYQDGVRLSDGAKIEAGGSVSITGNGGGSVGPFNRGVAVLGAECTITAGSGLVDIIGTAGPGGSSHGIGVCLQDAEVRTTGYARVTITGTGAGAVGSSANHGVQISGVGCQISTYGDQVGLSAAAGPGASLALLLMDQCSISNFAGFGIYLSADSISLDETVTIGPGGGVSFFPRNFSTVIDVGGTDAPGVLGLSNAELNRVTAGGITIRTLGSPASAHQTIGAPISLTGATNLRLLAGNILSAASGTDITLPSAGALDVGGTLLCAITGPAPDTGYARLKVVGGVSLRDASLNLAGTTFPGAPGDTFTLVDNDGTDPISSTFRQLPEGAYLFWPGSTSLLGRITYTGGDGNDAVLTLVEVATALVVTSVADSGPGTLRDCIAVAAVHLGPDTITFGVLPTQTIQVQSELVFMMAKVGNVTIDASSVPGGVTLSGGGTKRIFSVDGTGGPPGSVSLVGLTLAHGRNAGIGGAIRQYYAPLILTRCTLFENAGLNSGGAIHNTGGTLTLTQCTLAQNSAGGRDGGAIYCAGGASLVLTHCTLAGNSGRLGGAIYSQNAMTLTHTIVSGNTASSVGADLYLSETSGAIITAIGANLVGSNETVEAAFPAGPLVGTHASPLGAQLAPLGDYGGPTPTMALLPGSPARDAAIGSVVTSDQRGFPLVGVADIGAYEGGTFANFNSFIWETLPAAVTAAQHAAAFDFDGDGATNMQEWLALTDAADGASYLRIVALTRGEPHVTVTFPSAVGRSYTFETSTDLVIWTPIAGPSVAGTGAPLAVQLGPFPGVPQLFVRVHTRP